LRTLDPVGEDLAIEVALRGAEGAYILNEARRLRLTGVALKADSRRFEPESRH
jgi:hypothetical protein